MIAGSFTASRLSRGSLSGIGRLALRVPAAARCYTAGSLKINADRMMKTLHETCEWGAAHRYGDGPFETGMARLTLDKDDATARRWLWKEAEKLGCSVDVDEMGNMFMIRKGKKNGRPTAMGSHLDTQPTGGRYDGILGVMAGLEALRTMNDHDLETESRGAGQLDQRGGRTLPTVDRRLGCVVPRRAAGEGMESAGREGCVAHDEVGARQDRLPRIDAVQPRSHATGGTL